MVVAAMTKWVVQCICNQRGREKVGTKEEAAVGSGSSELLEKHVLFQCRYS